MPRKGFRTHVVPWGEDWIWDAACAGMDAEIFFDGYQRNRALTICHRCPVMLQCREWNDLCERRTSIRYMAGIFGGETPRMRTYRRRHMERG